MKRRIINGFLMATLLVGAVGTTVSCKDTDEDATESNRESIIKQRQDDLYDSVLEGWQESDGWTVDDKKLTKIDFKNRFTQTTESDTESTEAVESTEAN